MPPINQPGEPRIAVIGGGIIGLSAAYYLSKSNAEVVVCEKNQVGAGSTPRAAGGIRSSFPLGVDIQLSQASIEAWHTLTDEFSQDIRYRQNGYLMLGRDPESRNTFESMVARQQTHDVSAMVVDPESAARYCPGLDPSPFVAGSFAPEDGYADPHSALMGLQELACEQGVEVRTGVEVQDFRSDTDGHVTEVLTDDASDDLAVDKVVIAAGVWSRPLAAAAGIHLEIEPVLRRAAVVEPAQPFDSDLPLTVDLQTGVYFRPLDDETVLVGGHFEEDDDPVTPDPYPGDNVPLHWKQSALERAAEVTSFIDEEACIRETWSGLYAMTPDEHPVIEESAPGIFTATGFSGHGFMHAPAAGQLVADLVQDRTPRLDVAHDRFHRHRFGTDQEFDHNIQF